MTFSVEIWKISAFLLRPAICGRSRITSVTYRGLTEVLGENLMELRVNLKICEACGCLWYRSQLETRVYCTGCDERFREFPTPKNRKRPGRPKKTTLPTVFAVQAAALSKLAERDDLSVCKETWRFESTRLPSSHEPIIVDPALAIERTPLELAASQSAAFPSRASFVGGAN